MADAAARGWDSPGAPGSAQGRRYRKAHIVTVKAGGVALPVRREAASLFAGFVEEITRRGYRLDGVADDWGFAHRYIRGLEARRVLSNHAWGLAIDLNATTNPMGAVLRTDMPPWVIAAARRWGLSWGGDYRSRPDAMHFEVLLTPAQVAARVPLAGKPLAPAPPAPADDVDDPRNQPDDEEDDMFSDEDRALLRKVALLSEDTNRKVPVDLAGRLDYLRDKVGAELRRGLRAVGAALGLPVTDGEVGPKPPGR